MITRHPPDRGLDRTGTPIAQFSAAWTAMLGASYMLTATKEDELPRRLYHWPGYSLRSYEASRRRRAELWSDAEHGP